MREQLRRPYPITVLAGRTQWILYLGYIVLSSVTFQSTMFVPLNIARERKKKLWKPRATLLGKPLPLQLVHGNAIHSRIWGGGGVEYRLQGDCYLHKQGQRKQYLWLTSMCGTASGAFECIFPASLVWNSSTQQQWTIAISVKVNSLKKRNRNQLTQCLKCAHGAGKEDDLRRFIRENSSSLELGKFAACLVWPTKYASCINAYFCVYVETIIGFFF